MRAILVAALYPARYVAWLLDPGAQEYRADG